MYKRQALGRTIVVAESCTGGLVTAALTEIAGSSAVLEAGFVTYANEAKQRLLGVPADIIDTFGAVSCACAWAMAQGALKNSTADVAGAISGVAGPDGGTALKPVGLVAVSYTHLDVYKRQRPSHADHACTSPDACGTY